MTVDEFASQIGMSARNIRALQGRGLLPPPVRHGRRAFYLEQHVHRAEAIKDLQRQGFNLFAIGSMLGASENDPQAAGMAAMLERVANRHPALIAALQRHRIVARDANGQLRVIRPKAVQTALALRELGVPLPAAIGAKVAFPDETVVCVAGDGSLIMNIQELATCVTEGVAVKVFLMNNGYMGMVRQWQELFWDRRYSAVDMGFDSPDWVKLAEAFGATGLRCDNADDLEATMAKALETDGPVLVDVRVVREENCYPMIPPGQAARDMVEAPQEVR